MSVAATLGTGGALMLGMAYFRLVRRQSGQVVDNVEQLRQSHREMQQRSLTAAAAQPIVPDMQCPSCHHQQARRYAAIERTIDKTPAHLQFVCTHCDYKW